MEKNKNRLFLFIIISIFIIKGIFYAISVIPPSLGESPDEVGHFSYIHYLVNEKQLPVIRETKFFKNEHELFLNYYFGEINDYNSYILNTELSECSAPNKNRDSVFNLVTGCENWIVQHPPLYYLLLSPIFYIATLFTNKIVLVIYILRVTSVFIGALFIFFCYKILDYLEKNLYFKFIFFSMVLFSPMIQYYFSVITNDSLLILFSVISLFYLLKFDRKNKIKDFVLFAIFINLILLTKYTGGLIIIPYTIYFCFVLYQAKNNLSILKVVVLGIAISLFLSGPFIFRNIQLYNSVLPTFNNLYAESFDVSFLSFINSGYLINITDVSIFEVGMKKTLRTNNFIFLMNFIILFFGGGAFILLNKNNQEKKNRKLGLLSVGLIIVSLLVLSFIRVDLIRLFISGIYALVIFYYIFYVIQTLNFKNNEDQIIVFFIGSFIVVVLGFMYMHYNIYIINEGIRGTHGRYYFILIFQFVYFITFLYETTFKDKSYYKYIPYLIFLCTLTNEIYSIVFMYSIWK